MKKITLVRIFLNGFLTIMMLSSVVLSPQYTFADPTVPCTGTSTTDGSWIPVGCTPPYTGVTTTASTSAITVFVGKIDRRIVNPLIIFMFAAALAYFLFGVVQFFVNSTNGGEKNDGKQHMLWGVIGMFLMFSVFGILKLIENTFGIDVSANPILYR